MRPATLIHPPARRGFTLIEVLVVVGIVALLTGLVLAVLGKARHTANITRARSDLAVIAQALDLYRDDFTRYPQFTPLSALPANPDATTYWLDIAPDRGARLLCRTLIGPGPASDVPASGPLAPAAPGDDGADGPGFRLTRSVIRSTTPPSLGGKVHGPYLQPDHWKLAYDATGQTFARQQDAKILDNAGNPICYFPARPGAVNISATGGYVKTINTLSGPPPTGVPQPLYNAYDNSSYVVDYGSQAASLSPANMVPAADMLVILGDRNANGMIDPDEHAVTTGPYLLWCADPNNTYGSTDTNLTGTGTYGIQKDGYCRAVCNFDVPNAKLKP